MPPSVSLHECVLPPFFPRVVVEAAVESGVAREALFEGTDLPPTALDSPDARLSYAQLGTLIDNAQRLSGDPALAISAGERARLTSLGLLGAAVMSSANGGQALATLLRHWHGLCPGMAILVRHEKDRMHLELRPALELPGLEFLVDMMLVALAKQAELVLGRPPPVLEAYTINPSAPHRLQRFVERSGLKLGFDADRTEIVLDAEVLRWPCAHAEPNTRTLAERMHVQAMQASGAIDVDMVHHVQRLLDDSQDQNPSVTDIARELGTSARTLRRLLSAEGTSFRALREASLHRRATAMLREGGMTQVQISERLGYADVRAFRRAFKRWTGRTPSARPPAPQGEEAPSEHETRVVGSWTAG